MPCGVGVKMRWCEQGGGESTPCDVCVCSRCAHAVVFYSRSAVCLSPLYPCSFSYVGIHSRCSRLPPAPCGGRLPPPSVFIALISASIGSPVFLRCDIMLLFSATPFTCLLLVDVLPILWRPASRWSSLSGTRLVGLPTPLGSFDAFVCTMRSVAA